MLVADEHHVRFMLKCFGKVCSLWGMEFIAEQEPVTIKFQPDTSRIHR